MLNYMFLGRRDIYDFYLNKVEPVRHDQRVRDVQPHSISVFARALRGRSTLPYSVVAMLLLVSDKSGLHQL